MYKLKSQITGIYTENNIPSPVIDPMCSLKINSGVRCQYFYNGCWIKNTKCLLNISSSVNKCQYRLHITHLKALASKCESSPALTMNPYIISTLLKALPSGFQRNVWPLSCGQWWVSGWGWWWCSGAAGHLCLSGPANSWGPGTP